MNVRTFLRNGARIALLAVVATCTDQRSTTDPLATAPLSITPQVLPVIAPTLLTAGNSLTNTASYTTSSISPAPNTLVLVGVMGIRTFGASPSPSVTGGGMSNWSEVATVVFDSVAFVQRRMTVYRAMSASPGSGPLTITFANNQSNAQWIVVQWDGVETSGVNGAGAIGQTGSERGDLASGLSVTLEPFANSGNVAFGVFGVASGVHGLPMITPFAGFTEINEQVSQEFTPSDLQAEWATSLNTVAALWNSLHGGALAIEIKVATLAVASVTVDPATASVNVGATLPLTATPRDANGDPLTGRVVTWTSSDQAIATVSAAGVVSGVAGGSVTITATSEGQSGTAAVTVTVPVATVTVDPATPSVHVGATLQLTATTKDAAGNTLTGRAVTWSSSDETRATVSATGVVTGVGEGAVTITATSEGQSGTSAVTVTPAPVASVTVAPNPATVNVGATVQLTATLKDANGNTLSGRVVTWGTSAGAVATVSTTGLVTGVAPGTVTIAATSEGQVGTATVSVGQVFSHTLLTFGTNPTNGRVYTTASIAPAPNALVTVAVLQYSSQGTPPNPTLSGGGMQAWDVAATEIFDPGVGGFPMQRLTIFRAMSATPGSGPITITAPTVALSHAHWSVSQWTGVATGGVNGSGAIRQTGTLPGNGVNGLVVQLPPLASPTNVTYGAFGVQIRTTDVTPGLGFTEISEQPSGETTPGDLQTQWGTGLANVPATWATVPAPNAAGLAIEINTSSTPGPGPAAVATVTVAPNPATVNVGATLSLTATLKDASGNTLTGRTVTWASSDNSRATVTSTGLVTGVGVGPVTITATSEGQSGTAAVTVALAPVATVTVAPNPATVNVGATLTLTPTLKDANGNTLTGRTVTWSSSNTSLATVGATTGVVTGVAVGGPVTITATSEGQSGTSAVTVTQVLVANVTVAPNPATVNVGATLTLTPTLKDANGNTLTGRVVTWSSSNTSLATVGATTGAVTGVAVGGPVTITATSEGQSGTSAVTVVLAPVATVTVAPNPATVNVGATLQLTPTLKDANGNTLTGRTVTWASGDNSRATVTSTGLVTGVAVGGPVTITATSEGQSGTAAVTVALAPVATVTVAPPTANVNVGATVQLTATLKDANGNTLTGRVVTWSSGNTTLATVGATTGLVTGVAVGGPVTITATSEGQSGTATVTVTPVPVATVTVAPPTANVNVGATVPLTATLKDANGNTLTGRVVTWSSGNTSLATVGATTGVVTGVAMGGPVTITATSEGQSGSSAVTVTLVPVANVTVTPNPATVNVGATVQLTATLKDANGNTLTGRVVAWSSGNTALATVGATTGVVTGVAAGGPVTITATSEGQSGTAAVNVTMATVATVTVAPGSATVNQGSNRQFTATLRDANGNVVTGPVVTWTGTNGSALVDAAGLVWGLSPGAATITATADGTVGTASVTVTDFALLVGAGDISQCGSNKNGDEATALLLDGYPGDPVFTAGDNAYPDGTAANFADCYDPTWGRHKARTHPAAGNHDYHQTGASPYYNYFGANAGPAGLGYYSYDIGDWHVVMLNSGGEGGAPPVSAGSAQMQWLRADLAASQKQCQVAIWHHPLFSNDDSRPQVNNAIRPLWDTLWVYGVELVINAHDHHYVRYAPQTPKGGPHPTGIRQITVGTGGNSDFYGFSTPRSNVEVKNNVTHGVLELKLRNGSYDWRFVPVAGQTFTDVGTGNCVGPRLPPPNLLPIAQPGGPYQGDDRVAVDGRASSDPDNDTPLTYSWTFGDGNIGTGAQTTHTYAAPGVYTVTLKVTDALGGQSATVSTTATIANIAPTVNAGPDAAVGLGQPFNLLAGFSDPGLNDGPWTYVINWGDGTPNTSGSSAFQGASVISAAHVYAVAGQHNAVVTVTDKDGGTGTDAVTAIVTDVAPGTIVPTLLTAGNNPANQKVYTTAAFAPGSNALITVSVLEHSGLGTPPVPTLSGGGMATWDVVRTVTFGGGGALFGRLTTFRAMSAQPGNGPLTITSSLTLSNMQWIVSQWDGVDVSGVNGAGAVVQTGSASGAGANGLSVPLAAFGHPNNVAYGVFGVNKSTAAVTPGAGFTEITEVAAGENGGDLQAQWAKNIPTIGATWTNLTGGAIGIEIKVRP